MLGNSFASSVLALSHMLHIPTADDIRSGIAALEYETEQEILLVAYDKYDLARQHNEAFEWHFKVSAHVDHVENLDELAESVDVHGAIHFRWTNDHYAWNTTVYPAVGQISRQVLGFAPNKPWLPRPTFRNGIFIGREDFPQKRLFEHFLYEEASQLSINSNGSMVLSIPFSLRLPCNFDFSTFPRDEHKCKLGFQMVDQLDVLFGKDDEIADLTSAMPNRRVGEFTYRFEFDNGRSWMAFDRFFGGSAYNMHEYIFVFVLTRTSTSRYFYCLNLPLICCALLTASSLIAPLHIALTCFAVSLTCWIITMITMDEIIPASSDGAPWIVLMSSFVLVQLIAVSLSMFSIAVASRYYKNRPRPSLIVPVLNRRIEVHTLVSRILYTLNGALAASIFIGLLFIQSR